MLLLNILTSVVSGCGIYGWDPLGICLNQNEIIDDMPMKVRDAVNTVINNYTNDMWPKNFFDFTTSAMQIEALNQTIYERSINDTKRDLEKLIHNITMNGMDIYKGNPTWNAS